MTDLEPEPTSIKTILDKLKRIGDFDRDLLYAYIGAIENENLAKQSGFMSNQPPINKDKLDTTINELKKKLGAINDADMKKIIKHINQLPKYECYDPSNDKINEYCIPNLKEEHIVANEINRDQYDGVNLFTERAMKINAQDTADNSSGFDISGGPKFKGAVGGAASAASPGEVVDDDDEVVVDDKRDLYDLVDNFGTRDLGRKDNVEGQFTGQFITGTDS